MRSVLEAYFFNKSCTIQAGIRDPFGHHFSNCNEAAKVWSEQFSDTRILSFNAQGNFAQFSIKARYTGYYDFHLPCDKESCLTGYAAQDNNGLFTISLDFADLKAALDHDSGGAARYPIFAPRKTILQVEEDFELAPKFDARGLIAVITTDYDSGEVLMQGFMNQEALKRSMESGQAHYWSRSRQTLWHKGASSGLYQRIIELRVDDDQDALWMRVRVDGNQASCHVGYRSCFYRAIPIGEEKTRWQDIHLKYLESEKVFDPKIVYGDAPNPTIV